MQIDKEKRDTWKLQSKSKRWKVKCMAHENDMKITVLVCWCQNKHTYGIAQLVCIYTLLHFSRSWRDKLLYYEHWRDKQKYFYVYALFTFHIFNPRGSYSTSVREELWVKFYFGSFCFIKQALYPPALCTVVSDQSFPKLSCVCQS